jgi:hypothetical protein|tara:strand:+ start:435 stop:944 length:510 start_codon:yes stop_codon:yes gene_type:complete
MATAKDLIPQKYEVLKTRTGTELVGMTRDIGDAIEITLPMICHLSLIPNSQKTQVVFYPYSPLSKTERIRMPKDHVVHRTPMNDQFIPHYDSASSTWMEMLDKGTIPLGTDSDVRRTLDERIREAMRRLSNDLDIGLEEDTGYFSKDIEYDEFDEFEDALPPSDPKKIH